jgi:transcriptional regulator NrdR family protein
MRCPECQNSDANGETYLFRNLGGKRRYAGFNTRRYECTDCGHRFMSVERYHRDIIPAHPQGENAPDEASSPSPSTSSQA